MASEQGRTQFLSALLSVWESKADELAEVTADLLRRRLIDGLPLPPAEPPLGNSQVALRAGLHALRGELLDRLEPLPEGPALAADPARTGILTNALSNQKEAAVKEIHGQSPEVAAFLKWLFEERTEQEDTHDEIQARRRLVRGFVATVDWLANSFPSHRDIWRQLAASISADDVPTLATESLLKELISEPERGPSRGDRGCLGDLELERAAGLNMEDVPKDLLRPGDLAGINRHIDGCSRCAEIAAGFAIDLMQPDWAPGKDGHRHPPDYLLESVAECLMKGTLSEAKRAVRLARDHCIPCDDGCEERVLAFQEIHPDWSAATADSASKSEQIKLALLRLFHWGMGIIPGAQDATALELQKLVKEFGLQDLARLVDAVWDAVKAEEARRAGNYSDAGELLLNAKRIFHEATERSLRSSHGESLARRPGQTDIEASLLSMGWASIETSLGLIARQQGLYNEAEHHFQEARNRIQRIEGEERNNAVALIEHSRAELYRLQGKFDDAQAALNVARELNSHNPTGDFIILLSTALVIYDTEKDFAEAERLLEEADLGREAASDAERKMLDIFLDAAHYRRSGRPGDESIDLVEEAVEEFRELASKSQASTEWALRVRLLIADLWQRDGKAAIAKQEVRNVLEQAEQHGLSGIEADASSQLALLLANEDAAKSSDQERFLSKLDDYGRQACEFYTSQGVETPLAKQVASRWPQSVRDSAR